MKALIRILLVIVTGLSIFVGCCIFVDGFRDDVITFVNKHTSENLSVPVVTSSESTSISNTYTGESYANDSTYYVYYDMLNDNEKLLYGEIYENAMALNAEFETVVNISQDEAKETITALYNDHPELFWLDTNYSYSYAESDGTVRGMTLSFNTTADDIENAKALFEAAVNDIVNGASQYESAYEKEKYVHDTLINLIDYNLDADMSQSAYSALVNHSTVCAGYAKSFQYIMTRLSIPCYYVVGTAEQDHSWNIVELDGEFYNVDLTWDDQDYIIYSFFNVPDEIFSTTHTRTGLSVNLPACTGTTYASNDPSYIVPDQFRFYDYIAPEPEAVDVFGQDVEENSFAQPAY